MKHYFNRDIDHNKKPHLIYTTTLVITNVVLILMVIGSLTMSDMYTNGSLSIRMSNTSFVSHPKASFYTTQEEADEVNKIIDVIESETAAKENIYILQYYPMYYFLTGRNNATKYYFIEAYVYSEEKQLEVIRELEEKNVRLIISGPNHPETPEAVILNEYINTNYKIIDRVDKKIFYKKISPDKNI